MDSNQNDRYTQVTSRGNRKNKFNTGLKTARNKLKGFNRISNYINSSFQKNKNQLLAFDIQNTGNELTRIQTTFNENVTINGTLTVTNINVIEDINIQGGITTTNINASDSLFDTKDLFNTSNAFNAVVNSILTLSDNTVLIGGDFTKYKTNNRTRLVKLNSDFIEDTIFYKKLGESFNGEIKVIKEQADGKILIGGDFTSFNGNTRNRIVRLNSDGTEDSDYYTQMGAGFNNTVHEIFQMSDTTILYGGDFTQLGTTSIRQLIKTNVSGEFDHEFAVNLPYGTYLGVPYGVDDTVYTIAETLDNNILIGGDFNGNLIQAAFFGYPMRLLKLFSNGKAYDPIIENMGGSNVFDYTVYSVGFQSDGKIVVGGDFLTIDGTTSINHIARFNSDGTYDHDFHINLQNGQSYAGTRNGTGYETHQIQIQDDDKILVAGRFDVLCNVTYVYNLYRLNADGTYDEDFHSNFIGAGSRMGVNNFLWDVQIQSDDKILFGGNFTQVAGVTNINGLARINSNGTYDHDFDTTFGSGVNSGSFVLSIVEQSDNKITFGGSFTSIGGTTSINRICRINNDGTYDHDFDANVGTGFNGTYVWTVTEDLNNNILIGGDFTSFNGNTRNRIVRLNSDGTEDEDFYTNVNNGANGSVRTIDVQPDGKIIVGGEFTQFGGETKTRIIRLYADGTEDTAFYNNGPNGANGTVMTANIYKNQIFVGGDFSTYNSISSNRFAILDIYGTYQESFNDNLGYGLDDTVYKIVIGNNNDVIACGDFDSKPTSLFYPFPGYYILLPGIVKFDVNGIINSEFRNNVGDGNGLGSSDYIKNIKLLTNNEIILGGSFSNFSSNSINNIARISYNGVYDDGFNYNIGTGFNDDVNIIETLNDIIMVGGTFTQFNGNDASYFHIINNYGDTYQDGGLNTSNNTIVKSTFSYAYLYGSNSLITLSFANTINTFQFSQLTSGLYEFCSLSDNLITFNVPGTYLIHHSHTMKPYPTANNNSAKRISIYPKKNGNDAQQKDILYGSLREGTNFPDSITISNTNLFFMKENDTLAYFIEVLYTDTSYALVCEAYSTLYIQKIA